MRRVHALASAFVVSMVAAMSPPAISAAMASATPAPTSVEAPAATLGSSPGGLHPLPPNRILDTRSGLGAPRSKVAAGHGITVKVAGRAGVPATAASSVTLTVTAVAPTAAGYVAVHAAGTSLPVGSSLNYTAGQVVPNLVVTRMSADGYVTLDVGGSGAVDLLADVTGYVDGGVPTAPGAYVGVTPSRLLDTRSGLGAPKSAVKAGSTVRLTVAGRGGIPSSGAGAVAVNVTVVSPSAAGYLVAAPVVGTTVTTSTLNYVAGETRANLALVPLSSSGTIDIRVVGSGTAHIVADAVGYLRAGAPSADSMSSGVTPARLLDTRTTSAVAPGGTVTIQVVGRGGVPSAGVGAVILNVTETAATGPGYVTVTAAGAGLSESSNLNFTTGSTHANLVLAPVSSSGKVALSVRGSGTVQLIADVTGYVLGPPADTTAPDPVTALAATANGKTGISLTWTNPASADVAGVTIRRAVGSTPPASPYTGTLVVDTAASGLATTTSFTDSGLTPGETYAYAVFARDAVPNFATAASTTTATTGLTWTAPEGVAPYVGSPSSVSCPTTSWCMAVDRSGRGQSWNGTAWTAPVALGLPKDHQLDSVSCASTSFCVAVGEDGDRLVYRSGTWTATTSATGVRAVACVTETYCLAATGNGVATFDGATWSAVRTVAPSGVSLEEISCPSASMCVAVGNSYLSSEQREQGWAVRFDGASWTATQIAVSGVYDLHVSCASATACMVVGGGGATVRWNGSTWSAPGVVGGQGELIPRALSCATSSMCLVVNPYSDTYRWDGSAWSMVARAPTTAVPFQAIDCPTTSMCMLLDGSGRATRWTGSGWTSATVVNPTSGGLVDLSCPTATACMGTDERGSSHRLEDATWSAPDRITTAGSNVSCVSSTWCMTTQSAYPTQSSRIYTGTWSASLPTNAAAADLDCVDASFCVAFDDTGRAVRWNGTSWSNPAAVLTVAGSPATSDVDCVSRSFCMAVGGSSAPGWSRWNGTSWTARALLGNGDALADIACSSTTSCVALSSTGTSYVWNGSTWRTISAQDGGLTGMRSIDCASPVFCVALVYDGSVATFNGTSWRRQHDPVGLGQDDPQRVECPSVDRCVAVGRTLAAIAH